MLKDHFVRSLPINLDELAEAIDLIDSLELHHFLDTQTGEIVSVSDEFYDEDADPDEESEEDADLPDWQEPKRELARTIMKDDAGRFQDIPAVDRHESYRLMEEFIGTVQQDRPRDVLSRAIDGKGAFRRFKDALLDFPVLREQWFDFHAKRKREWAEEWLESIGLRSTWAPPKRACNCLGRTMPLAYGGKKMDSGLGRGAGRRGHVVGAFTGDRTGDGWRVVLCRHCWRDGACPGRQSELDPVTGSHPRAVAVHSRESSDRDRHRLKFLSDLYCPPSRSRFFSQDAR
jgi:hypothetical protein